MLTDEELGKKIKKVRLNCGLNMTEFAKTVDGNAMSGTVANWESGRNKPNKKRLEIIARLNHQTVEQFLEINSMDERLENMTIKELKHYARLYLESVGD